MRLSNLSDADLEKLAIEALKRASSPTYAPPGVREVQEARAAAYHELLDRRHEEALRVRSAPAIKLAIAHVEMLREAAVANKQPASVACLDMQLSLLKEFDG